MCLSLFLIYLYNKKCIYFFSSVRQINVRGFRGFSTRKTDFPHSEENLIKKICRNRCLIAVPEAIQIKETTLTLHMSFLKGHL